MLSPFALFHQEMGQTGDTSETSALPLDCRLPSWQAEQTWDTLTLHGLLEIWNWVILNLFLVKNPSQTWSLKVLLL